MVKLLTGLLMMFSVTTAEATTIHLTASTYDEQQYPFPLHHSAPFHDVTIDAILTLEPIFGSYFQPKYGRYEQRTNWVVTSLDGTMNGEAITLLGDIGTSWFLFPDSLSTLRFATAEANYFLWWDGWFRFYGLPDHNNSMGFIPLTVGATEVEPVTNFARFASVTDDADTVTVPDASSSILLLAVGLASVAGIKRYRPRLRVISPVPRSLR